METTNIKRAVGAIIFSIETNRILFQLRSENRRGQNLWGFFGGNLDGDERPVDALKREITEEVGFLPNHEKIYPIHRMMSNNDNFEYFTYLLSTTEEFIPDLNGESAGYAWVGYENSPSPLHPGAKVVLYNPQIMAKISTIVKSLENVDFANGSI